MQPKACTSRRCPNFNPLPPRPLVALEEGEAVSALEEEEEERLVLPPPVLVVLLPTLSSSSSSSKKPPRGLERRGIKTSYAPLPWTASIRSSLACFYLSLNV